MPDLDILQRAVQELENELSNFKSARELLEEARKKADDDLERWRRLQSAEATNVNELVATVQHAHNATMQLVEQVTIIAERMTVLSKAINTAGFPQGLELLQTNVANMVTTVQSVQSRLDLLEVNQNNTITLTAQNAVREVQEQAEQTKKELAGELTGEMMRLSTMLVAKTKGLMAVQIGTIVLQLATMVALLVWLIR